LKKKYQNINSEKKYNELKENNSYASCDSIQNDELNFSEQSEFSLSSYDEINKKEVPIMASSNHKITNYFKTTSQLFDMTKKTSKKNKNKNKNKKKYKMLRKMSMTELNVNDKNAWDCISFKIRNKREGEKEEEDGKDGGKYNSSGKINLNKFVNYEMAIEYLKKNGNSNIKGINNLIGKKYTRCKYIKINKNMNKYFYMYKYKEMKLTNRKGDNNDENKYYAIKEMLFNISCIEIKKTYYIFIKRIPFLLNYEMCYFQNGINIQYVSSELNISEDLCILKNEKNNYNKILDKKKEMSCIDCPNKRTYAWEEKRGTCN
ncbi:hypothetical protein, partial [Plasmodium yoelii yoelii]